MNSNVFSRMFLFVFTLMFPFVLFLTLFRFSSGVNNMYGFYDLLNGISRISQVDLTYHATDLNDSLQALRMVAISFKDFFSITLKGTNYLNTLTWLNTSTIARTIKLVLTAIFVLGDLLVNLGKCGYYLLLGINLIINVISSILNIVVDIIPFVIDIVSFFILCLNSNVYALFGEITSVGNMSWTQHYEWFNNLV